MDRADEERRVRPVEDVGVQRVIPPALTIGDPAGITVGWTVTNLGTGAGQTDTWVDPVIASADTVVGNSDDQVLARVAGLRTNLQTLRSDSGFALRHPDFRHFPMILTRTRFFRFPSNSP